MAARIVTTLAFSACLLHVWCAFNYLYQWSHAIACRDTARQTAELFGIQWGDGLYLNYCSQPSDWRTARGLCGSQDPLGPAQRCTCFSPSCA